MKKAIGVLFLLIIILVTFSYVYLKYSSIGPPDNYFNSHLRVKFAYYPVWRNILSLHSDGDGRADYLGPSHKKIIVKVIMMEGIFMDEKVLQEFSEKMGSATGKITDYLILPDTIPYEPAVSLGELKMKLGERPSEDAAMDASILYLIVANQNEDDVQSVGYTLGENAIVLFEDMISQNYNRDKNMEAFDQYAASVLLHEFGHQIGLPHNEYTACLMNSSVELGGADGDIISDFCDYEKRLIAKMLF